MNWSSVAKYFCVLTLSLVLAPRPGRSETLSILPVYQRTHVWCWAAVSEMIFRHYGLPNIDERDDYQCSIVKSVVKASGGQCASDCGNCVFPAVTMADLENNIHLYSLAVTNETHSRTRVMSVAMVNRLEPQYVAEQIRAGRPIVAAISAGAPFYYRHVALVIGIEGSGPNANLIVNDPFPFREAGRRDPYIAVGAKKVRPGQYSIQFQLFVERFKWTNSILTQVRAGEPELSSVSVSLAPAEASSIRGAKPGWSSDEAATPGERERAEKMLARGKRNLEDGNIAIARQFFLRAAEAALARGALLLAATYDARELTRLRVQGVQPDLVVARKWYERARELGASEADERLDRLEH
jgi:alkylhydroperoxidase family enzyme